MYICPNTTIVILSHYFFFLFFFWGFFFFSYANKIWTTGMFSVLQPQTWLMCCFFPRISTSLHIQWLKQLVKKPDAGLKEGPSWRPHLGGTHISGSHIWDWSGVSWPGAELTVLSRNWRRLMKLVFCGSRHPPHSLPGNSNEDEDVGQIWPECCSYVKGGGWAS